MRFYLDTEFIELPSRIALISIGVASEDGRSFHIVTDDWRREDLEPWHVENVLPHIEGLPSFPLAIVREKLTAFVLATPPDHGRRSHEFWGYFSAYDWTITCHRVFGKMLNLPEGFPRHCNDLKQLMDDMGVKKSDLPAQKAGAHDALEDAKWNRLVHEFLTGAIDELLEKVSRRNKDERM